MHLLIILLRNILNIIKLASILNNFFFFNIYILKIKVEYKLILIIKIFKKKKKN